MRNDLIQRALDRYVYLINHFDLSPSEARLSVFDDYELIYKERVKLQSEMLIKLEMILERGGRIEQ